MKKNIFSLLLILFSLSAFAQHAKKDLIGKWEGADSQGTKASINFLDTSKVSVTINGAPLPPYSYNMNFAKTPATIDIIMKKMDGQDAVLPGFLLFVDNNTVKWQIVPDGNRPVAYDETSGGPVITLKRIK
jgi:hypothetical protein